MLARLVVPPPVNPPTLVEEWPASALPDDEGADPLDAVVRRVMPALMQFEGFEAEPYLCSARRWTIGFGSTFYEDGRPVRPTDPAITKGAAYRLARHTLREVFIPGVQRLCPGLDTPRRVAAVTLWTYNLGLGALQGSTMRRRINEQDWPAAARECLRWVHAGGVRQRGLVTRRQAEAAMLLQGMVKETGHG